MSNNTPFPTIEFSVYQVSNNEILFSDVVSGGQLTWKTDTILVVRSLVGRPRFGQSDENILYKYNVIKRIKI